MSSRCGAFPPVDGFCVGGHAVEQAGDELDVSAATSGEAELPQLCGGTMVVVDRLIRGIGVDLAGTVAVDLCPDVAKKSGQLRFVVGAHAFGAARRSALVAMTRTVPCFNRVGPRPGLTSGYRAMAVISSRHAARLLSRG